MTVTRTAGLLIEPYGGRLVDLLEPPRARRAQAARRRAAVDPGLGAGRVRPGAAGHRRLLPLDRFMGQRGLRARAGRDAPGRAASSSRSRSRCRSSRRRRSSSIRTVALRNAKNELLAVMTVEEIYEWDRDEVAAAGVRHARPAPSAGRRDAPLGHAATSPGRCACCSCRAHYDFQELRLTPAETRAGLEQFGHANVVAFQTRNPLHRAHEELTKRAVAGGRTGCCCCIRSSGMTKPGDVDHYTRVRTYKALAERLLRARPHPAVAAAAGHAHGRPARGAVARAHPPQLRRQPLDRRPRPRQPRAWTRTASRSTAPTMPRSWCEQHADELGVGHGAVPASWSTCPTRSATRRARSVAGRRRTASISGTQVRDEYLNNGPHAAGLVHAAGGGRDPGRDLPAAPPAGGVHLVHRAVSGAGKSTTAEVLTVLLLEHGRQVDGAGRRRGAHAPVEGPGLQQGGPRHQHPPHRLRGGGDRAPRRPGGLRGGQPLPRDPQRRAQRWSAASSSSRSSSTRRWRSASSATSRACTPRRGAARSRTSPASTTRTRRPENPEITLDTTAHSPEDNARRVIEYLIEQGYVRALEGYNS